MAATTTSPLSTNTSAASSISSSAISSSQSSPLTPTDESNSSMIGSRNYPPDVGILALEVYFPSKYVDQSELEQFDRVSAGKYTVGLGQTQMGVLNDREDINSMSLTVGTETLLDKSKSVKTVLMSLFETSGNFDVVGIDTKNACYGGTASVFNAVNWIESSSWDGRLAIVVAADIASYAEGPARPTGGAGAVAILVGPHSSLVFDRGVRATYMNHVWDFYKPELACEYPIVDGHFSNTCYIRSFEACYRLYTKKFSERCHPIANGGSHSDGKSSRVKTQDLDHVVFHAPNCKLVQKAFGRMAYVDLLQDPENTLYTSIKDWSERFDKSQYEESLGDKDLERAMIEFSKHDYQTRVLPSLYAATNVGNMYTASMWAGLASLMSVTPESDLLNKRVGLFSYGSGSAATFFSLKILANAGSVIKKFKETIRIQARLQEDRIKVSPQVYADHMKLREETAALLKDYVPKGEISTLVKGTYYLARVDEKSRRFYARV
ncbi:hypothetical protein BGZ83_001418 [Gryganskiella cystojenkinii]|nr:hypothetical protein BGZ83_001418 [Gryganskiella cystojenkinii]